MGSHMQAPQAHLGSNTVTSGPVPGVRGEVTRSSCPVSLEIPGDDLHNLKSRSPALKPPSKPSCDSGGSLSQTPHLGSPGVWRPDAQTTRPTPEAAVPAPPPGRGRCGGRLPGRCGKRLGSRALPAGDSSAPSLSLLPAVAAAASPPPLQCAGDRGPRPQARPSRSGAGVRAWRMCPAARERSSPSSGRRRGGMPDARPGWAPAMAGRRPRPTPHRQSQSRSCCAARFPGTF